jgi:hypothetical protein
MLNLKLDRFYLYFGDNVVSQHPVALCLLIIHFFVPSYVQLSSKFKIQL